ncbi:MAG: double-strand break repair protein AddB, partial [Pacificimonas sp.]
MAEPKVYNIPAHGSFADRLAVGLLRGEPWGAGQAAQMELARTLILLPNRRAIRTLRDAFVRAAGGALLLPRMVALGDLEDDDIVPGALDELDGDALPVVSPLERTMRLMPLVERWQARTGQKRAKVETLRFAEALGQTLDLLQRHDIAPSDLHDIVADDLAEQWKRTTEFLAIVLDAWPGILTQYGLSDGAATRQSLVKSLTNRWRESSPRHPVLAAGIADAEAARAKLLGVIARMPRGAIVLPGLDMSMSEGVWDDLGRADPHPQVPLKELLEGMSIARPEVRNWPVEAETDGPPSRDMLLSTAFAPPDETAEWRAVALPETVQTGLRFAELRSPAGEAMAISLTLRQALDEPGRTAALVTPDRDLARRVAAQMRRWKIDVDD